MEYYIVNIDGTEVKVSEFRIKHLFGELSEIEDVNQQRATIIAQREIQMKKCAIVANLDFYAGLIMGGEWEIGKHLSFRVDIYPLKWYVTIEHRKDGDYTLHAFNMNDLSEHNRVFAKKDDALLFCANRFNEEVVTKNLYQNIDELFDASTAQLKDATPEVALVKRIEHAINSSVFDGDKFAEAVCYMHHTLEQNFYRIIRSCMLYRAANSRGVDGRNKASYEMCLKLVQVMRETSLPFI